MISNLIAFFILDKGLLFFFCAQYLRFLTELGFCYFIFLMRPSEPVHFFLFQLICYFGFPPVCYWLDTALELMLRWSLVLLPLCF